MGGYGSGRWGYHSKKSTVEDCMTLSVGDLLGWGYLAPGAYRSGRVTWSNSITGEERNSIGIAVESGTGTRKLLRIDYTIVRTQEKVSISVEMVSTHPHFGGLRYWFICPLAAANGQGCHRRVGKLYSPPGGKYYGCRHCYDLTYTSCQESHKLDSLAKHMGWDFKTVRRLLNPRSRVH